MQSGKEKSPFEKSKEEYIDIIKKIGVDGGVGIDTQLTHAMILDYLRQLNQKVDLIEKKIEERGMK